MKSKQSADPRSDRTLQEFVGGARRFRRRSQARSGSRLARLQLRLDQFTALLLLLLLAPLMAVIALLVWRCDGAPVLFGHYRIGQHGRPFRCLKFRSMYLDSEAMLRELLERDPAARAEWERDHKLNDDPRITPIGHFLRRTSLDELPQLFNVLRGEMSLVGPRPITLAELPRYGQVRWHYLSVRPGMTGLWQVSGRSDLSWDDTVRLDLYYVDNWSMVQDMAILLRTFGAVVGKSGAY